MSATLVEIFGVDGRPKPAEPAKPHPCVEPHCWHLCGEQHTVANHSDWTCCMCGARHCVRTRGPVRAWEHGPHAGPSQAMGCGVVLGQVVLP
jgi:hypothetical protein